MKKYVFLLICVFSFCFNVKADILSGKYFLNNFDEEGHKLNKNNGIFEVAADNSAKSYSYKEPYLKMEGDYFLLNFSLAIVVAPDIEQDKNSLWAGNYQCMVGHQTDGPSTTFYCSQQDLYNHYVVPGDAKFVFYIRAIWDDGNWNTCQVQNSFSSNVTIKCSIINKNAKLKGFQIISNGLSTGLAGVRASYSFDSQLYAYKSDSTIIQENQQQNNENAQKQLEESKKQTEEQKKQTDFLTSDEAPSSDISGLGNVQGLLPGPADSLLNIPFKFLSIVTSSFGGICKPIKTGIWNNVDVVIPCFNELIYANVPDWLMIYLDLIPAGFILISYLKYFYKKVERAQSLETNSNDQWGVL